jgi:COP9 signalosome complex subunit 5
MIHININYLSVILIITTYWFLSFYKDISKKIDLIQKNKKIKMEVTQDPTEMEVAQKTWELANQIQEVNSIEEIYKYDEEGHRNLLNEKPWEKSVDYFKSVKVSALALLKMVIHARSGGNIEVMGLLLGKVDGQTMFVMDSFALPVEGTETRVNAHVQAYEYMVTYTGMAKQV